jgi:hypothetical protein
MLCKPNPFNGLHDIISQKIDLFITSAMRTSNPILVCINLCTTVRIQDKIKML